ncbi:MAG TPA: hypothetical protein VEB66_01855 [Opitutaceae bacterium]|nr:hypothetical protein [Opitutaceae bacterium]
MSGLAALAIAVAAPAQGDFTAIMTAEERTAAGLDKLTPEELARLRAVVERYKAGEVAVVRQRAAEEVAVVRREADAVVAQVQAAAEKARDAKPAAEKKPGWLKALVTLQEVAERPDEQEAFEARLATEFQGWRRNMTFTLDDGSRWQVIGDDDYVSPPRPTPRVRIRPGLLGSYWMEVEGVRPRVKVKPLKL